MERKTVAGYTDPAKPNFPHLHQWHFRSALEHYIWIIGMIYAYYHPTVEQWMEKLEETEVKGKVSIQMAVTIIALPVPIHLLTYILFPRIPIFIDEISIKLVDGVILV
ncbi:hypothetical protein J1N35_018474 [Gossypium stocksii]|uniref:Uncharacterized protein n=1 Tax=Gossypium stocksii TaxID=47602 RepID=A0A9D3VQ01_9ROSI|nr:hypothetical protein J1N35_018474 [Gossypium stocksii]